MTARIFKPAKNAMQSGTAKTKEWQLDYEPEQPRAIEPLRKARAERRSLLGGWLGGSGNACVLKDIDAALTALGAPPPAASKRRRR